MKLRYNIVLVCLAIAFVNLVTGHWLVMLGNLSAIPVVLVGAWVLDWMTREGRRA